LTSTAQIKAVPKPLKEPEVPEFHTNVYWVTPQIVSETEFEDLFKDYE
jgi:hypothetical protein